MLLEIHVPDILADELRGAARARQMSLHGLVYELLHAEIAAHRLPSVTAGRCGARVIGWQPEVTRSTSQEPEDAALQPSDIPTVDDIGVLEDIL